MSEMNEQTGKSAAESEQVVLSFTPILREVCLRHTANAEDPAHDVVHIERVVRWAERLAKEEGADLAVVAPAAWFHDLVSLRKDDPRRKRSSRLSADRAVGELASIGYPPRYLEAVHHAIEAHSFSAAVTPRTIEACVVQDADRLDALGAIGVMRAAVTGGALGRPIYEADDPFCDRRQPDDSRWTLDHFYRKLLSLEESFTTSAGRKEAVRRTAFIRMFLAELRDELR